jgi:hypothetical protein
MNHQPRGPEDRLGHGRWSKRLSNERRSADLSDEEKVAPAREILAAASTVSGSGCLRGQ